LLKQAGMIISFEEWVAEPIPFDFSCIEKVKNLSQVTLKVKSYDAASERSGR